jgi:rRNA small subunit pseudouridine methyltransferase Nep1
MTGMKRNITENSSDLVVKKSKKSKKNKKKSKKSKKEVAEVVAEPVEQEEEAKVPVPSISVPLSSAPTPAADTRKLVVVLEKASLEVVKTKRGYELVNSNTHAGILKKLRKKPGDYRPDILHRALLNLLDSPLNKAGRMKLYIHTETNVLIEVNPKCRLPRTFQRFAGLMVQLLHKLKIRATDGPEVLLKCIKTPVTQHLPPGSIKIATSVTGELVRVNDWARTLPRDKDVVMMFGSHAHGLCDVDWAEQRIAVSQYPLSASIAIDRTVAAFENCWGIL